MKECMNFIKSKNRSLYTHQAELKTKDHVKVILVSATLDQKIEALSSELMDNETRVGFDVEETADDKLSLDKIIPVTITQYYMILPLQFKLLYLIAFLVAHKESKIIVFLNTCEEVNYMYKLIQELDFNHFWKSNDL